MKDLLPRMFRSFCLICLAANICFLASCQSSTQRNQPGQLNSLLSENQFNLLFPHRNSVYSYSALIEAASKFPDFLGESDAMLSRNELAAFLANVAQETTGGWPAAPGGPLNWGLVYTEEQTCRNGNCPQYDQAGSSSFLPVKGKNYHGRGALQLSYAYNYGQAGKDLNLPLLEHPELASTDSVAAFETAIWFWMRPQAGKPSCHDVMSGAWNPTAQDLKSGRKAGFGMVINIINGGIECGKGRSADAASKAAGRIAFYTYFASKLGVSADIDCDCAQMQSYPVH